MGHKTYTYEVHTSTREDLNEGWVWLRNEKDEGLKNELDARRQIVCISHLKNQVYCEALYINKRDLEWFKERFETVPANDKIIFISQWYRQFLDINGKLPASHDLAVVVAKLGLNQVIWQIRACLEHPQIVVLLSTVLGIISVGLGFIGSGLGLIAIPIFSPHIFSFINIFIDEMKCFGVVLVIIGAVAIYYGVNHLFRRAIHNPLRTYPEINPRMISAEAI